jgi:uncharacterized protein YcaQ
LARQRDGEVLKADRQAATQAVLDAFGEPGVDQRLVATELDTQLMLMAGWLGLGMVDVGDRGDLAKQLRGCRAAAEP